MEAIIAPPRADAKTPGSTRLDPRPEPALSNSSALRANSDTEAARLYALALAWSERTNIGFSMLDTVKRTLVTEASSNAALSTLCLALDHLGSCDEESELLNALAKQASRQAGTADPTHRYTYAQLIAALQRVATIADTLNRTLMEAQQCTEDEQGMRTTLIDAAQLHVQLLGAVADEASGSRTMGDLSMWVHGLDFASKGAA